MADRCLNADILATTLLGNNEGFAKQIVGLAQEKNAISSIAGDSARTKQLTKQIDMQIQSMIEARILFGDAGDAAKQKLLKGLRNKGGTLGAGARLLDMIDSLSVENVEEYAWLVGKDRTDVAGVKQSITDLKFAVSDFIAAKNNLKVNYGTKFYNKLLKKSERIKALGDWWRADLKTVRSGGTPTELVNPDEQWRHIVNMTGGDLAKREKLFNNWVLGRTFLGEDDSAVTAFVTVAKKFDNTLPSITVDDINSFTNVNELINRVYTNTLDIAHSRELRFALKAKLIELIHQGDIPLTLVEDSIRLTNTTLFADAGDSLTSILKYDNTAKAVRNTLIDEKGKSRVSSTLSSKEIFNELKKILERPGLKKELLGKDGKKLIQGFGTKLDGEELLKIIYAMSWDNEVKQVVEMHYAISDELIIDFAKAKLFGIDVKKGEKNLRDIIEKFSKPYSPDEISTMAFVATSGVPVKPTDNSKIAFVHFADENLTLEDDALMSRAKFNDDLAGVNTLTVTTTNIPTFDITYGVAHVPSDLEYVVIPNANVANSNRIKELKNKLEKYGKNNKYTIVFPKSRQSGQYFVDVDGKLKFKTTNTELFNEMSNKLAINSFNNATIDLTENTVENRELIQASNERRLQILNDDAVAFFKNYMGTAAEGLDDKQIIQKVSDMTGIPLDPNEANLAGDWELAQRVMFSNYTVSGRYVKDIVTKEKLNSVEQTIRGMSDEEVLKEINKMGHTINKPTALKNIEAIREALINMRTTDSLIDYVWNKGVIIGLGNMDTVTNLTIENFKSILASDNPLEGLANLFFGGRAVTKAELESMNAYLSDIMDSLISDFSHNLLTDGYQMPLLSPRKAFMSYLKGDVNINDEFIQAFAFKNGLEEDYNLVKKIFDDHMPSEINVDGLINKDTLTSVRRENKGGLVVRELNENERFLPTTYNSYTAVMGKVDIPSQTFSRQATRVTADGVRKILKRFFTDKELEGISINFYDNLIDGIGEGRYTSDGMQRALDFVRNPEEVTPYHETVHMYIDMFLTKEQREELLNGIYQKNKRAIGKFIRDNGYKVDDALAAAEEWIAENFIKFVKGQDVRLNKDTRNWFQKLWDTIKSWFNKIPEEKLDSLNQFYSDIYNRVRPEGGALSKDKIVSYYRVDNTGRLLTGPQKVYFQDSVARDADGNLQQFYHGGIEDFDEFDFDRIGENGISKGPGFYFSSSKELADEFGGKKLSVYLDIRNPYIEGETKDLGLDVWKRIFDRLNEEGYIREDRVNILQNGVSGKGTFISQGDNTRASNFFNSLINKKGVNEEFMKILGEETGYDSFATLKSSGGWGVVAVFNKNQVKRIDNLAPTSSPNVRYRRGFYDSGVESVEGLRNYIGGGNEATYDGLTYGDYDEKRKKIGLDWRRYSEEEQHKNDITSTIHSFLNIARDMQSRGIEPNFEDVVKNTKEYFSTFADQKKAKKYTDILSTLDKSLYSYNSVNRTPEEIAKAILDYSYNSLDKSEIGNVISKNGRMNWKAFDKLSDDEKLDIMNRFGAREDYFQISDDIDIISGVKGGYTDESKFHKIEAAILEKYDLSKKIDASFKDKTKLEDFIGYATESGRLPHEIGIFTDSDNNVLSTTIGTAGANRATTDDYKYAGGAKKYYHNHPNMSFFSPADLKAFKFYENKGIDTVGLILPGGVILEFPNTKEFRDLVEQSYKLSNGLIKSIFASTLSQEGIKNAYYVASNLGIVDKQNWGRYSDLISNNKRTGGLLDLDTSNKIDSEILETLYDMQDFYEEALTPTGESVMRWRRAGDNGPVGNPTLTEDEIIRNILNKYENAVEQHIKNKTMTTKVAQDLKQQASYALNIATQDLILARYGSLLSASDREGLLGMGYNLKLASNTKELNALKQANAQTMGKFKERWGELAKQYNVLFSNTEELNKKLLESGKVFTERDGQQAVVDVWDELENSIKSIPDTAGEFASLKQLTKGTIRELSPRQAYIMLKTVDLVKNNITRGNFYTQLMYQLNPQLRKAVNGLDFFQSFKAVDVGGGVWVPWSLTSNATNGYVEAGKAVLDEADTAYKAGITKAIYEGYIRNGTELTPEALEGIVRKELGGTNDEAYAQHYIDAFMPYTNLKGLSENVKTYINQLLNQESNEVQALLKEAGADMDGLMDTTVVLDDGSTVAIKDIINGNVDGWKQRMFGGLSDNGDELYANKQSQRNIQEEMNGAYAWFNDVALVSDNQSRAITQILGNARKILQRDTHTQKFVEFDNAIGGQNDILKGLMQFYLFSGFKRGLTQEEIAKQSKTWVKIKHGLVSRKGMFSDDVWSDVQKIYEVYYSKTLRELNGITTPKDGVHQVALELAKYFKQLEQRLGSKNGATGVSVIPRVNIAFGNLGSVVRNVHSEDGVWSLMNKIGNNQVIGLFKFTREGESAYNEFLKNLATNKQSERWLSNALNGGSVELIEGNKREIQRQFNEVFGSNFSESDVNVIVQGLGGYQIVNSQWGKVFSKINSLIARAGRTTRMLMTYPFQLFTIHPQLFAYNVKSSTEKKILGVEDLSLTRDVRKKYGVLEGTYVELNPGGWIGENARKLKEIMSRDSDELTDVGLELDDGILGLYGKTTTYTDKKYTVPQQLALFDSLRDNANNIIDASQAQTFKGIAFLKALQKNDYMTFMNAEAFDAFMNRSDVSQAVKDKVLDKVNVYANRIFNDLLGTGFTGLDKAYGGGKVSDFFIGLLSTINFKGAWGTNIFRQTFEKLGTVLKVGWERYAKGNREAADEMRRYVISTPEFTNLTECLWGDMIWAWKMGKYGKNGYIPDDESEVEMMDYVSWIFDNIELVSQQWQGLISFGGTRPFTSAINAVYGTRDKGLESVGYGAGAFINSLVQNFGRGWKPWSLGVDALMVAERDGFWAGWDYLRENFYTLSAGTMRYMIEEGYNAYGANTALTNQPGGIPAFMVGNQYEGSDTAFSYKVRQYQTWDYLKNMFDKDEGSYARGELLSSVINASQFLKIGTNAVKSAVGGLALTVGGEIPDWAKSKKGVYSILDIQEDFEQSPTFIQFMETGKAMPPDQKKTNKLIELYTNANYPGGYKAYDGIQNFKNTGHVNGNKDKGYYYDEGLEEFYARIEQTSPGELDRFMKYYSTAFLGDPNGEAGRQFAYNWAVSWLNKFTNDSQYNVYTSALYKGNLNNYYYEMLDAEARRLTEINKALGLPKEQAKVSRTDINNLDDVKDAINRRFLEEHYDEMYRADAELMQNQIYQWIADELEPGVVNGYFTKQPEINYAGNETGEDEWVISNNIKGQIKDLIFVEKAIDDGRWEDALTRGAILTQSLNYDDEMGLIRASAVDYYAYRIINSDWPDTVKQSAFAWLIHNNEDVFTYDSDLAKKYGEYYDAANEYKNEVLYNVTLDDINLLNAMAISLHQQGEDTKGGASSGVKVAAKLNNLRGALESSPSGGKGYGASASSAKWAAVPIKGLSAMGYKPATVDKKIKFETVYKSQGYDPRTKTLGPITPPKKNKAIKGKSTRKMTQKEENELDLI